jgi:iron complex outermembrane receptor protein
VAQERSPQDSVRRDSTERFILEPLQVTVTRAPTAVTDVPFAVSALSAPTELKGRVTAGLDEVLATVPGVYVANRHNPSLDQRVSIRGFGSRSAFGVRGVKILLDGVPQTLPDGQGQLTNVELSSVGDIEVLRGSASSLYGNASGGVINLKTAPPDPTRLTPVARFVAGAYNTVKWRAGVSAPIGRGTVAITGAQTVTDGYRQHSEADMRQLGLRVEQEVTPGTSLLVTAHLADKPVLDNPGSLTGEEVAADPSQANARNLAADAGKAVTQGQVGLTLSRQFATGGTLDLTVFGLGRDLENPLSFAYISIDRRAFGFRGSVTTPLAIGDYRPRMSLGFDFQRQRDDRMNWNPDRSDITLDQLERVTELGPFIQVAVDVARRATLTLGSRFDRVSFSADDRFLDDGDDSGGRVMSAWSGSVGLVIRATEALQPYASVSTSFETPTTTELVNRPTGTGGFNPELDPQKATSVELGFRGGHENIFRYSAAVFQANVRDELISFEVPTVPGRSFFQNAGSARHRGVELETIAQPVPGITVITSYTLADYRFTDFATEDGAFDGNHLPGVPRHNLHASLRLEARSGLWIASDNTFSSSYYVDDANTAENESWFVSSLRGGWEGVVGGWRVAPFAGVLNLFGDRYVGSVVVNAGFGRYFEPAPPRNAYMGIELAPY